ncbi:hypothetical protein KTR10_03155 [Candidatus Kaiserbacteria bacterium]|nr:hypothetical protein [Candidatus Kaiserbacteria bacterium]
MRIVYFLALFLAALFSPWWFFLCASAVYLWHFTGYELFVIAILIDVHFGSGGLIGGAFYTVTFTILFILMSILKPNLRF